jgi:hypothetical protein
VVTGATYSSKVILKAIENALIKWRNSNWYVEEQTQNICVCFFVYIKLQITYITMKHNKKIIV